MLTQDCKIPDWKEKKKAIQKQSFDEAFENLGTRQEFFKKEEKKEVVKEVSCEKVNS